MIDIFSLKVEELSAKIKDSQLTSVEICKKYIENQFKLLEMNENFFTQQDSTRKSSNDYKSSWVSLRKLNLDVLKELF